MTINQQQNPGSGTCFDSEIPGPTRNMCALVNQNTTGGKNLSGVAELYRQFQSGAHTESLTQRQDPDVTMNGIDHDIHQLSAGSDPSGPQRNWIQTFQLGRQVQRAKNAAIVNQFQDPRTAKGFGSNQVGSEADTWFGRMFGSQLQTTDGQPTITPCCTSGQEQLLTYDADATGVIDVFVRGSNNGDSDEISCDSGTPGDPCHVQVECSGATFGESELPVVQPADCQAIEPS
jgi:hypothetical protein